MSDATRLNYKFRKGICNVCNEAIDDHPMAIGPRGVVCIGFTDEPDTDVVDRIERYVEDQLNEELNSE